MTRKIGEIARLRKRELFRRLGYTPHPGQALVHRSKASRRVLACGSRWGKSVCAAMETIAALMEPRDSALGWLVAPTYDVADRIFKRVTALVLTHFPHRVIEHLPREHRIIVRNFGAGVSELRAKSADRPESLLGEALDFLVVDEGARLRPDVWNTYLSQRLIDRRGWALLVSTPQGCNWYRDLFKLGQAGHDLAFESWSMPSWANPHVPSEQIEAERKRLHPDVFAQEFGGEFYGAYPDPCKLCGGPADDAGPIPLWDEGEPIPTCKLCGEPVDHRGRTVISKRPLGPYPAGLVGGRAQQT